MTDLKRVLIVDDEPDVLLLCRVNLEFEGYHVTTAADGQEGLATARSLQPDVVLLDVMMPKMDGWQVLEAIKADEVISDIPVVMLTAKVQDEDQIRGWSAGAAEYITKPFSPLSLSQVIAGVIANDPEDEAKRRQMILEKLKLLQAG
ncbi:MAG: adenylate cyclase [Nitriliruptoraceae bacterium]|jgi:adenylate cyclase